jgi:hypothetical protein
MQMVVLPGSGGFTPVAPMLFTSQLTLSVLVTGCCLTLLWNKWYAKGSVMERLLVVGPCGKSL